MSEKVQEEWFMRIRRIENESFSEDSSVEKNINVVKTVVLIEANMKDPLL